MNRTVYQPMRGCGCGGGDERRVSSVIQHASPGRQERETVGCCTNPAEQDACGMKDHALAMAYVKIQTLGELYDPCTALIAGTLFPALDKPFCGETISASAYPNPPARTCDCTLPTTRDRNCGCQRGGDSRD